MIFFVIGCEMVYFVNLIKRKKKGDGNNVIIEDIKSPR